MADADVAIVGAGIVGLATAYQLTRLRPDVRLVVLDKESELGSHQSGRNSGVLHSGIYYRPGSRKAVNCRAGKQAMQQFCTAEGIPFEICGKVIVATSQQELPALELIYQRGQANGVACELVDQARLRELEPHAAGIRAIHVPEAGIVDYRRVCQRLAERTTETQHARIVLSARVQALRPDRGHTIVDTTAGPFRVRRLINCAGLHSDRIAALSGGKPPAQIVPFRGEYYLLAPEARQLVQNLIYPVPDPAYPFLGVHFTRLVNGSVECGPNAVLALGREAYSKGQFNLRDLAQTLTYPGFFRLAVKHWRMGAGELHRSLSKRAFVRALQRLVPEVRGEQLAAAPAGIRAQAVRRNGDLVDDFMLCEHESTLNVCNAPSPAATASLNIGKVVAERVLQQL
jgi:L-2-hydroxyglutarate oxidase